MLLADVEDDWIFNVPVLPVPLQISNVSDVGITEFKVFVFKVFVPKFKALLSDTVPYKLIALPVIVTVLVVAPIFINLVLPARAPIYIYIDFLVLYL